jgi:hypothetical protein
MRNSKRNVFVGDLTFMFPVCRSSTHKRETITRQQGGKKMNLVKRLVFAHPQRCAIAAAVFFMACFRVNGYTINTS